MTEFRYDGGRLARLIDDGILDAKEIRKWMKRFSRDINKQVIGLKNAIQSKDRSDHYIAHNVRDFFWGLGFMRAGHLASFIHTHDWEDSTVVSAMSNLEVEAEEAKVIADKIVRAELPIEGIID